MTMTWNRQAQYVATAASFLAALVQLLYFNSLVAPAATLAVGLYVAWNRNETVTPSEWRLLASTATLTTLFLGYPWLRLTLPYHYNLVAFAVLAAVMAAHVPAVWRRLGGRPAPAAGWRRLLAVGLVVLLMAPHAAAAPGTAKADKAGSPAWCHDVQRLAKAGAPRVDISDHRVKANPEAGRSMAISIDFKHRFNLGACYPHGIIQPLLAALCQTDAPCAQPEPTEPGRCTRNIPPTCTYGDVEMCITVYPSPCGNGYEQVPRPIGCWRLACPNVYITPTKVTVEVHLTFGRVRHQVVNEELHFGMPGLVIAAQACLRGMQCGMNGQEQPFHATVSGITNAKLQEWGFPKNMGAIYVQTTVTYTYLAPDAKPFACLALECSKKPVGGEKTAERTVLKSVRLQFGSGQLSHPISAGLGAVSSFLWNTVDARVPGLGLGALLQPKLVDQVRLRN